MTKYVLGERVFIAGPELRRIYEKTGFVVDVFEQEPASSNFYTVSIDGNDYTVFENEMRKA